MSVPAFGDLGKLARDLLRSGYTYDRAKVKMTKPLNEFVLECDATVNLQNMEPSISGFIKYDTVDYGKISSKISSDGPLVFEYSCNGKIVENIDLLAGYSINLKDSFQSCKLATQFHNSMLHTGLSFTKDFDRNLDVQGSVVIKSNNFIAGYQTGFDTNTSEMTKNNLTFTYDYGNILVHFRCIRIPREFGLSIFFPVNDQLKVAVDTKLASNQDLKLWYIGTGFSYKLTDFCKLRMKFDKNLQLGSNMEFQIKDSLLLTLACNMDFSNVKGGQHKIGLGLDING